MSAFRQEPPPGTVEKEGTPCWKCSGTGFKYVFLLLMLHFARTIKKQKRECNVCHGSGKIISEVRKKLYLQPGRVMEERRYFSGNSKRNVDGPRTV